jgi:hypothetical protein
METVACLALLVLYLICVGSLIYLIKRNIKNIP